MTLRAALPALTWIQVIQPVAGALARYFEQIRLE